jgi:ribosomal protein S18 acetylase RimI-like enzyme
MQTEYGSQFPPQVATLKDGRRLTLRLLAEDDAEALGDFYESMPRETWRFYCPSKLTREDAAKKAARALNPTVVCLVAVDETTGQIAGYDWYRWRNAEGRASVFGICLREAYRGIGLGRALIQRLLAIAHLLGRSYKFGPPVMSLTVQLANPRAVALYTKMGFRIVREQVRGQVADFPAEPEYTMEQTLR